jgi:uncharacterized protein
LTLSLARSVSAAEAPGASPPVAARETSLLLTQTAQRRVPRDVLRVEIRAEQTAQTPQAVEASINRLMATALPQAQQTQGVEVETGSYAVYRTAPVNSPPEWTGRQTLSLSGPGAGALLQLAGRLQSEGLIMSNLVYEVSPKTLRSVEDSLTAQALANLKARAAAIAQQLHLNVTGYRTLAVGNTQPGEGPRPIFAATAEAQGAAMPPPVGAAGEATLTVTVNATILLAPK